MKTTFPEEIAPLIARWLAPYVASELSKTQPDTSSTGLNYDDQTCAEYVRELGIGVQNRAIDFFMALDQNGRIGSLDLAQAIGTSSPRNIPANLTNSLKQRAKKLALAVPWDETSDEENRLVWLDRDGIAARMVEALRAEHHRRFGPR
jgi:hypothetical protein